LLKCNTTYCGWMLWITQNIQGSNVTGYVNFDQVRFEPKSRSVAYSTTQNVSSLHYKTGFYSYGEERLSVHGDI
jgi:hypothetical protein